MLIDLVGERASKMKLRFPVWKAEELMKSLPNLRDTKNAAYLGRIR